MNERTKRVNLAYRWLIWLGEVDDKLSFAQRLGKERANITNILNGKGDASDKFCGIILSSFPGIFNRDWLLDGVGDMLATTEAYRLRRTELRSIAGRCSERREA